jgi:lysyl-tRNA synthetase class 2
MAVVTVTPFRQRLQGRAQLYALIRAFFAERSVLEVETPILSASGNTDPNIESFSAPFNGHADAGARERWLRTSPEHPLKRLLADGVGDCYELGRVFRTTPNSPCWSGTGSDGHIDS